MVLAMPNTELIARLRGLTGTLKSGAWSTIAEAADALQAMEPSELDKTADNSKVICPNCCHQFTAIPVNVQTRLQALERVPMTEEVALKIAHRRATTYTHRSDPHYSGYAFVPYTLMDFVRDLEAHHNITPPESKG